MQRTMSSGFKFEYRKLKTCQVCGEVKKMLRMQKTCDDCRRALGKSGPRGLKGTGI